MPPPARLFLAHLDPMVREMLVLFLAELDAAVPVHILHDEATSLLDDSGRSFFTILAKVAREGPVDLIILGVNNDLSDLAVIGLRAFFDCPILALTSIVDSESERRLLRAGVVDVFHAPDVHPLFERVQHHLRNACPVRLPAP